MKKLIALSFAILLVFSLAACGSEAAQPSESSTSQSDEQIFATFKELAEKGKTVIHWYRGDVYDGNDNGLEIELDGSELENPDFDTPYRKVGMFGTIAEMKAATEEVFSREFCIMLLYSGAFTDASSEDRPLYKEIDGVLHRNIYGGGFGWSYHLTGDYEVALQTEDLITLKVKCNGPDEDYWIDCKMIKENGNWKLEKLYGYSPDQ